MLKVLQVIYYLTFQLIRVYQRKSIPIHLNVIKNIPRLNHQHQLYASSICCQKFVYRDSSREAYNLKR